MEKPEINLYSFFPRKKKFIFDRETYDCSVLFFNISGSFQYRIGNQPFAVANPGDIIYCPPNTVFQRKAISPVELHMIKFNGKLPKSTYRITARILDDLKALSHKKVAKRPNIDNLTEHYARDIIYTLSEESIPSLVMPIIKYMDENCHLPITNKTLCDMLHCSEVSLIAQVKALTGKTPRQYINDRRIERAKEILLSYDIPISAVAARTGFDDPLYFSKAFSKATGMSPSKFKSKFTI